MGHLSHEILGSGRRNLGAEAMFRLLLRYKRVILLPAFVGAALAALLAYSMKNQYRAKATILVEPQSLPSQFMASSLPYGIETYVRSLVEQIKSRTRLEQVIHEFDLYPEERRTWPMEAVVEKMRSRIQIERRGQDTFSVSFTGSDPEKVQKVTNRLTQLFIDENSSYRLERLQRNVDFLMRQAARFRAQVAERERKIQAYKSAHLDVLPENRTSLQLRLSSARSQLQANRDAQASAKSRISMLLDQARFYGVSDKETGRPAADDEFDRLKKEFDDARAQLIAEQARKTEHHPDIKALKKRIAALEARLAAKRAARASSKKASKRRKKPLSRERMRIVEELRMTRAELARLDSEREHLEGEIEELTKRIERIPEVELTLKELSEGLAVLKEQADSYQKKATDAAASLAMERGSQGSQFRALDLARLPHTPVSPNRPLIIVLGFLAGAALGAVLVVGIDLILHPFEDERDLTDYVGIPLLISIPQVGEPPTEWQRIWPRLRFLWMALIGRIPRAFRRYEDRGAVHRLGTAMVSRRGPASEGDGESMGVGARTWEEKPGERRSRGISLGRERARDGSSRGRGEVEDIASTPSAGEEDGEGAVSSFSSSVPAPLSNGECVLGVRWSISKGRLNGSCLEEGEGHGDDSLREEGKE